MSKDEPSKVAEPSERQGEGSAPDVQPGTDSRWKTFSLQTLRWIPELFVFGALVMLVARYRLLHLEAIEVGGDALKVWEYARTSVLGGDVADKLNHHTSRFGLVWPSILAQKIAGSQATSYYLGPLTASVVSHAFVYLAVRRLGGMLAGLLTVLAMLEFTPLHRASSQILPETFGPMYAMGAYLAAIYLPDLHRRWAQALCLGFASIFLFFAYGAKMNYLLYAPGLALLVWLGTKAAPAENSPGSTEQAGTTRVGRVYRFAKRHHLIVPAVLTFLVTLLLSLEFLVFRTSGESGRLAVISKSHGAGGLKGPRITEFKDFFLLYTRAPHVWTPLFVGTLFSGFGLVAFSKERRSKLLTLGLIAFFLLQTFSVRHFDPLIAWMEPHPRYLLATVPFSFVLIGLFVHETFSHIWRQLGDWTRTGRNSQRLIIATISFSVLLLNWNTVNDGFEHDFEKRSGWSKTRRMSATLSRHFAAGMPVVSRTKEGKPVWAAGAVWIDPKLLVRNEKLRSYKDFFGTLKPRGKVLASDLFGRDQTKLRSLVERRTKRKECLVLLEQRGRFSRFNPRVKKGCLSLAKELENFPGRVKWRRHKTSKKTIPRRAPGKR